MSTVLSSIPFFWIDSVVGYCFFILLVFGFVYKLLRF